MIHTMLRWVNIIRVYTCRVYTVYTYVDLNMYAIICGLEYIREYRWIGIYTRIYVD